jgi:hypothetical protein
MPQELPVERELLGTEHYRLLKEAIEKFDTALGTVLIRPEVVDEKLSLIDKIEALFIEMCEGNV